MITFLSLLLVASFAEESFTEPEQERTHMAPAEGLAVVFYSKQFRFTKLADPGQDNAKVWADNADPSTRNLFLLDKDQGDYFIRDASSNRRLGCASNTNIYAVPSDSTIWPDQLWTFRGPDSDGFYEIVNVHRPKYQIGLMSSTKVGCWDTTWSDGKYWKWRLEDIFTATAMWKSIAELDNDSDTDGNYQYKKTVGYTQSITESEAHKSSVSQSLEFSAGGALKGIDLGATSTTTMTEEFSSSVSNSMSGTFTTTETLTWPVPAGTCLQILQVQVAQDDTMKDIQDMTFYSTKTKIQNCPGSRSGRKSQRKAITRSNGYDDLCGCRYAYCESQVLDTAQCCAYYRENSECDGAKPNSCAATCVGEKFKGGSRKGQDVCSVTICGDPLNWIDLDTGGCTREPYMKHACCDQKTCELGDMAMAMATPDSTGPHWAVKVLAFVGFAVSVYGAACHYTKPKEQVTF